MKNIDIINLIFFMKYLNEKAVIFVSKHRIHIRVGRNNVWPWLEKVLTGVLSCGQMTGRTKAKGESEKMSTPGDEP